MQWVRIVSIALLPGFLHLQSFDCLYSMQNWRETAWKSYHVSHSKADDMDSSHNSLFTFWSSLAWPELNRVWPYETNSGGIEGLGTRLVLASMAIYRLDTIPQVGNSAIE